MCVLHFSDSIQFFQSVEEEPLLLVVSVEHITAPYQRDTVLSASLHIYDQRFNISHMYSIYQTVCS